MNHGRGTAIAQGSNQCGTVANITLDEVGLFARDARHTRQCLWLAVAEVVKNRDIKPRMEQLDASVGADVTGTARNKNHGKEGELEVRRSLA